MKYKLDNICKIGSSKRIYLSEYKKSGIPFYRGKEIIEKSNNQQTSSELYISKERYLEIKDKFEVPHKGDILLSAVGTLGKSWFVDEEEFYFKDGNLIWLSNFNNKIVNNKYLFYKLNSKWFKNLIESISIGSTQKAITIDSLKKTDILLPDLDKQNKIVKILNIMNDKIKNNIETNNNLYDLASKLYEEKFITCRNEEWDEYKLIDIANIVNGYSYKGTELVNDSSIGMATIKNFDRNGGFKEDGFKSLNPNKVKDSQYIEKFGVVVACTDLTQNADIIGNANLLLSKAKYEKVIISMDLVKIVPNSDLTDNFMIYSILNSQEFKKFALGYTSGTTVLHLNKNCFKDYIIKLPGKNEIDNFIETIKPIYIKISQIMEENKVLEKLRDTLLPKLMNGEIDLENIEV